MVVRPPLVQRQQRGALAACELRRHVGPEHEASGPAAIAAGLLGVDLDPVTAKVVLDRDRVPRADVEARPDREHARPPDQHRLEAALDRAQPLELRDQLGNGGVRELAGWSGRRARLGEHDMRQSGDSGLAIDQRQPDARAEPDRDQLIAVCPGDRELAHPDVLHGRQAVISARPSGASRSVALPWLGSSMNEIAHASPSTTSSESSTNAMSHVAGGLRQHARDDRAEQVGQHLWRAREQLEARHRAERREVGGAEDVADLAERRIRHVAARLDAEHLAELVRALWLDQQEDHAIEVAAQRQRDARHGLAGVARGVDRLCQRQGERSRHVQIDGAAEHLRERGRGSARGDVRELAQRIELHVGVRDQGRLLSA